MKVRMSELGVGIYISTIYACAYMRHTLLEEVFEADVERVNCLLLPLRVLGAFLELVVKFCGVWEEEGRG